MLDIGRMLTESVMLIEREELSGPDYQLQQSAHKEWAAYIGDQKVRVGSSKQLSEIKNRSLFDF